MKNTIDDLRNHLFATIEALMDPEKPMPVDQAKAINQTAQVLINAAKVEVQYLDVTGQTAGGSFFPGKRNLPLPLAPGNSHAQKPVARLLPCNGRGQKP